MSDSFKTENVFKKVVQGFVVTSETVTGNGSFTISKSGRTLWKDLFVVPTKMSTTPWNKGSHSSTWSGMDIISGITLSGTTVTVPQIDTYLGYNVYPRCSCTEITVYYIDPPRRCKVNTGTFLLILLKGGKLRE